MTCQILVVWGGGGRGGKSDMACQILGMWPSEAAGGCTINPFVIFVHTLNNNIFIIRFRVFAFKNIRFKSILIIFMFEIIQNLWRPLQGPTCLQHLRKRNDSEARAAAPYRALCLWRPPPPP